jgi:hypothetical protein
MGAPQHSCVKHVTERRGNGVGENDVGEFDDPDGGDGLAYCISQGTRRRSSSSNLRAGNSSSCIGGRGYLAGQGSPDCLSSSRDCPFPPGVLQRSDDVHQGHQAGGDPARSFHRSPATFPTRSLAKGQSRHGGNWVPRYRRLLPHVSVQAAAKRSAR